MPFQIAHLRGSQAVTISNQDHRAVAMTMPIALGGIDQPLDLALSEIATANCEVYRCWRAGIGCLFSHEKSLSCKDDWNFFRVWNQYYFCLAKKQKNLQNNLLRFSLER